MRGSPGSGPMMAGAGGRSMSTRPDYSPGSMVSSPLSGAGGAVSTTFATALSRLLTRHVQGIGAAAGAAAAAGAGAGERSRRQRMASATSSFGNAPGDDDGWPRGAGGSSPPPPVPSPGYGYDRFAQPSISPVQGGAAGALGAVALAAAAGRPSHSRMSSSEQDMWSAREGSYDASESDADMRRVSDVPSASLYGEEDEDAREHLADDGNAPLGAFVAAGGSDRPRPQPRPSGESRPSVDDAYYTASVHSGEEAVNFGSSGSNGSPNTQGGSGSDSTPSSGRIGVALSPEQTSSRAPWASQYQPSSRGSRAMSSQGGQAGGSSTGLGHGTTQPRRSEGSWW